MQSGAGKVPVIECVREAWLFLFSHWRLFLAPAAIGAVIAQLGYAAVLMAPADPAEPRTALGQFMSELLIMAPAMIAGLLFSAAVLRKAIRNEFTGRYGLAFGKDERQLLGVLGAMLCLVVPLGGLFVLVMSITVLSRIDPAVLETILADPEQLNEALIAALGEDGVAALSLFILIVFAVVLYVSARLFMINAATIGERKIVLFQTWSWTRGNVFRVLGAIMLTVLPSMFVGNLLDALRFELIARVATEATAVPVFVVLNAVISFATAILNIPGIVLGAVLYRGLRPPGFVPK